MSPSSEACNLARTSRLREEGAVESGFPSRVTRKKFSGCKVRQAPVWTMALLPNPRRSISDGRCRDCEIETGGGSCARWLMEAMTTRIITVPEKRDVRGGGIEPDSRHHTAVPGPFLSTPPPSDWPPSAWWLTNASDTLAFYIPRSTNNSIDLLIRPYYISYCKFCRIAPHRPSGPSSTRFLSSVVYPRL